jgi:hypothetical protein
MTDRKQSAVARRLAKLNDAVIIQNETTTNQLISQQVNTNTLGISNLNSEVYSLQNQNNNLASSLQFQLDDTQPTSLMARVIDLENNPSGGGGGIDPTDPTQPILIVENFLNLNNGDRGDGVVIPYSYPTVSPTLLNNFSFTVTAANSEPDHLGIIELEPFESVVCGFALGSQGNEPLLRFGDLNTTTLIFRTAGIKDSFFRFGLNNDLENTGGIDQTTDGIYFELLSTDTNFFAVTKTSSTQTRTNTGVAWVANTWYILKITRNSSNQPIFTINTTEVTNTTNIPTGFLNLGISVFRDVTNATTYDLDFFSLKLGDVTPVSNGQELNELHDVNITSIANNDVLQWDSTDNRWENRSIATAGIASATHTHTYDQVNNVQASRLIGRWTSAGTGSLQEITLGRGFKLSTAGELSTNMGQVVDVVTTITAGNGLIGGGDLSQNRSLSVNFAANGEVSSSKAVRADDSRLNNIPSGGGLFDIDGGDSGTYTGTPILDGGGA